MHATLVVLSGFLILQVTGFRMFPGIGWFDGLSVFKYLSELSIVRSSIRAYAFARLAVCAAAGWLKGQYFVNCLKDYIQIWEFWQGTGF